MKVVAPLAGKLEAAPLFSSNSGLNGFVSLGEGRPIGVP
jgi:hypothetical protein